MDRNLLTLYKDTLKMQALNVDELQSVQQRQEVINGYQALNFILLYNSPALRNKSVIPAQYHISAKRFLKLYKETLLQLHKRMNNHTPKNKQGLTNYLKVDKSINNNELKMPEISMVNVKKAYTQAQNASSKLLREHKYLNQVIQQYSNTIQPLLKDIALPKDVSEVKFIDAFTSVLRASRERDSNV